MGKGQVKVQSSYVKKVFVRNDFKKVFKLTTAAERVLL